MRRVLCMVVFGSLLGAAAQNDDTKDSASSFKGNWEGTSIDSRGVERKRGSFLSVWEINDNQVITIHRKTREGKAVTVIWKYRIVDSKKNPKEIDFTPGDGPAAGKTLKGIYAIEKDTLKIAYPLPTDSEVEKRQRPTEFRTTNDNGIMILHFERPGTVAGIGDAQRKAVRPVTIARRDPFTILRMPAVRKDLKLSEEQVKQVQDKDAELDLRLRAQRDAAGQLPGPGYDRQARLECEKAVARILNTEQAKRLRQIERQQAGAWGFTDPELAKELGLTEAQLRSMREIKGRFIKRHSELFRALNGGRSGEKVFQQLKELEKDRDGPLLKLLTPAQAKKWQELTGPPLELRR